MMGGLWHCVYGGDGELLVDILRAEGVVAF